MCDHILAQSKYKTRTEELNGETGLPTALAESSFHIFPVIIFGGAHCLAGTLSGMLHCLLDCSENHAGDTVPILLMKKQMLREFSHLSSFQSLLDGSAFSHSITHSAAANLASRMSTDTEALAYHRTFALAFPWA